MSFRKLGLFIGGLLAFISMAQAAQDAASHVSVFFNEPLGEAGQITDFLGAGGNLYIYSNRPDSAVARAWTDLGMRHLTFETMHVEDPTHRWIAVRRNAQGAIEIDFTEYDRHIQNYVRNLNVPTGIYIVKTDGKKPLKLVVIR